MRRLAGAAFVAAMVFVGCSDDDKPDAAPTTTSEPTSTTIAPANLCNVLTPAALLAITGIDFAAGTFDGTSCVWLAADGSRLGMAVLRDPLLAGWFVVVGNQGGQPVAVPEVTRAVGSSNPEGPNTHVMLAVETHPAVGISVTLIGPSATVDHAVALAQQVFSAAGN